VHARRFATLYQNADRFEIPTRRISESPAQRLNLRRRQEECVPVSRRRFLEGAAAGVPHRTFRLAPDLQGSMYSDPDHSYAGGRIEYNGGACDGWLRAGDNDEFAIGYYTKKDLPFFAAAATRWTTLIWRRY
jgi:phosphoesterase family protein